MKKFNTTAVCIPSIHYMVDLTERVAEIKKMVDAGEYFVINRARQYGKTTTLEALIELLKDEYIVLSLDFQKISASVFEDERQFVKTLCRHILFSDIDLPEDIAAELKEMANRNEFFALLDELFHVINLWCIESDKPVVMIVDEVDSASNNQPFLDFLAQLRADYIAQVKNPQKKTFKSVILCGVTDIRHLKSKIRDDGQHRLNSPWNIAADFNIDMSLSESGIRGMLEEYENDHHTGMDTAFVAKFIRDYTNGYPFLVSRICELVDTVVSKTLEPRKAWSDVGLNEAVKLLLSEKNTLFQSITGKLENFPDMKEAVRSILMEGTRLSYNVNQDDIVQLEMYGLIRNDQNTVRISNRIFEMVLYNMFLSDEELKKNIFAKEGEKGRNIFVTDGKLNMRLILERFIATFTQIYGPLQEKFKEKDGRELFLLYLKPIINGTGNYYIEAETRDQTRTDVIVDYLGQQYIIEMKIWHGERYNADGEKQISDYLDYFDLTTGYMLSFNFNKNKKIGVQRVEIGDKVLFEGVV